MKKSQQYSGSEIDEDENDSSSSSSSSSSVGHHRVRRPLQQQQQQEGNSGSAANDNHSSIDNDGHNNNSNNIGNTTNSGSGAKHHHEELRIAAPRGGGGGDSSASNSSYSSSGPFTPPVASPTRPQHEVEGVDGGDKKMMPSSSQQHQQQQGKQQQLPHREPPPQAPILDDNNNNNGGSTTYADVVMNGVGDSMTHLAMNTPQKSQQQQQQQRQQQQDRLMGVPEGGAIDPTNPNNNNANNANSSSENGNDHQLTPPQCHPQHHQQQQQQQQQQQINIQPDPNHVNFQIQSGGETTVEHSANYDPTNNNNNSNNNSNNINIGNGSDNNNIGNDNNHPMNNNMGELHRRTSDAMSIDQSSTHQQHEDGGGEEYNYQEQQQQPQHASIIVGEATMAVHNHEYTSNSNNRGTGTTTTTNNSNNNTTNNAATVAATAAAASDSISSASGTSGDAMIITVPTTKEQRSSSTSPLSLGGRYGNNNIGMVQQGRLMERLSDILRRGSLVMINFSQRNLGSNDANLIRSAILSNPQLAVLKLAYNNLGNIGANMIAEAIHIGCSSGSGGEGGDDGESLQNDNHHQQQRQPQHHHHPSLSVLDLGFNNIGDEGCTSLANLAVARNPALATLYLSGNAVRQSGALALADVIASGCGLISLHLTANRIGAVGVKGLMRSIAEFDVTMQMAQQDRENRIALEEEKTKRVQQLREERERNNNDDDDEDGRQNREEEEDAILGSLELDDGDDGQDDLARLNGFKCLEELHLGGTNMESTGCLSVSNMLLTNLTLKVLCLSDNGLNDQDLSLFSQSISRNRQLPLETLQLSFNKLTCVGVETLMNAIWGSKTLREIKLDNNQIRDRGAQLAAVVLTSVHLEVLDMGFNRLTIVGIKALMKSLAENCSLLTLTLSGNVLDTNASKAVSYALAYNKTIQKLYVDHCSLSYAAQRHIAAGIVSNSKLALRVMSGFPLGAISVTLGLPGAMENWTNEQVLKFIRVMWDRTRHERENATLAASKDSTSTMGASENSATAPSVNSTQQEEPRSGPSDPATVVAAANGAFEALGDAGGALLLTEEPQRAISDTSPMVSSDAVMLEKTSSGTVRVPSLNEYPHEHFRTGSNTPIPLDASISHASIASVDSLCTANGKSCPETPVDPEAKKRNMEWLRTHYRSLNEIIQLPYVYADLLQLHRYFYSSGEVDDEDSIHDGMPPPGPGFNLGTAPSPPPQKLSGLQRKISYRGLDSIGGGTSTTFPASSNFSHASESSSKRRTMSGDESLLQPPANKRARSGKPRIDYFPRLKAQIETCLSSSKQTKALILLRQLKFVETTMFQGINPYCDQSLQVEPNEPTARDAEIILIDML